MAVRGRVLGAIALSRAESGGSYAEDDLAFAKELARRAAFALDNARLYAEAKDAIRRRDEFLSIASHELKTPLTSIELTVGGLARAAERGRLVATGGPLTDVLEPARRQLDRLKALVEDLLDASRVQEGRLTIRREPTDLAALAEDVVARFAEDASRAGCRLVLEAPAPVTGLWDRDRLDQVLTNLVSNALKYGGGEVRVGARAEGERALLTVADQGPGIDPADHERIFERFERSASTSLAGFGLGLWIVREIVRAHGGDVRLSSALGAGAAFTVTLPSDVGAGDAHHHGGR